MTGQSRLRVLLSAYACEPAKGSEPGVGWNMAVHLAEHHEVWVLTRANNRSSIEAELAEKGLWNLHFVYHDLPSWGRFWKRGQRGLRLYYYLWQLKAIPLVRRLHREVRFDLAVHVTFVKYWAPSALAFLDAVHFVWGPVGGGESAPFVFWPTFSLRGILYETLRGVARWVSERDPLVRITARRANIALATTNETAARLRRLGVQRVEVISEAALPDRDLESLSQLQPPPPRPVRFLSIGRLLHWKGFHLGLMAFASSDLQDAEYWIAGDGPEYNRLDRLVKRLGVVDRVRFFGHKPRREVLQLLGQCHVLVHPSLHDSGGWVSLEALAAGRPVICLDLGGPAVQVTEECGIKVPVCLPRQVVNDLSLAMCTLASNAELRNRMAEQGRRRIAEHFVWKNRVMHLLQLYVGER